MGVALAPWLPLPIPALPLTKPTQLGATKSRPCFGCYSSMVTQADSQQLSSAISPSYTYRHAVILPGLGNNTNDYEKLALILKDYGVPTVVLKVSRIDWLRNAAGLLDPNY